MIPYLGKHETKQFICGKSIRFGFKLWCLASTVGYLPHTAPHCGAGSKLPDLVLGQDADVVLNLAEKGGLSYGFSVTIKNLFNSFSLLKELSKGGIEGLVFIS